VTRRTEEVKCDDDGVTAPRAVFRTSPLAVLGAVAIAFCITPAAIAVPFGAVLYLAPIVMVVWILRVRTTADAEAVAVRRIVGGRRVPWSEISSLRLRKRGVSAVLSDGTELPLPALGLRELPQLAAVSGGHLRDPGEEQVHSPGSRPDPPAEGETGSA
jgi:Bacterial PH domain